jgi:hypothetical protein
MARRHDRQLLSNCRLIRIALTHRLASQDEDKSQETLLIVNVQPMHRVDEPEAGSRGIQPARYFEISERREILGRSFTGSLSLSGNLFAFNANCSSLPAAGSGKSVAGGFLNKCMADRGGASAVRQLNPEVRYVPERRIIRQQNGWHSR